ncbi:hypothetical protein B0H17DRAFT_1212117 [Mycena rosella]|uniref:No apical meristem-associated C-terminal domain-containing protein n=1 Tax=Mycena rosella TaxID=1033263 RepID=A0AAD7CT27_MYCRO|nr:hypothetical protein B0H17DRAFT_1212117 [Mycena rosella]
MAMNLRHPQYNFPPTLFQYIPPEQFYCGLPPPPAPYGPVPQPENTEHPQPVFSAPSPQPLPQPSPPSQPMKRRPGRPRKDATGLKSPQATAKASAKAAPKKASVKAAAAKSKRKGTQLAAQEEKENAGISDSDSEIEESGRRNWSDEEKTKASEKLFNGNRTAKSIGSLWARSAQTFAWIIVFEGLTGNGGGDPDLDDPAAILGHKMEAARKASFNICDLKRHQLGEERLARLVQCTVVRDSASALSDIDVNVDDGDEVIDPSLRDEDHASQTSAPAKNSAAIVSELKHTPVSRFHAQANNSLGNMGEYIKIKMASEEKKAKVMDAKLELDQAKLLLEKQKADAEAQKTKVEMARAVLQMEGVSAEPIISLARRNLCFSLNVVDHDFLIAIAIVSLVWIFV